MGFAGREEIAVFLAAVIATEPGWRPVLAPYLSVSIEAPPIERSALARAIGGMLLRVRDDRLHADLSQLLRQLA